MPLTKNGKIDRKRLMGGLSQREVTFVTEEKLRELAGSLATPAYVFDTDILEKKSRMDTGNAFIRQSCVFAIKANSIPGKCVGRSCGAL